MLLSDLCTDICMFTVHSKGIKLLYIIFPFFQHQAECGSFFFAILHSHTTKHYEKTMPWIMCHELLVTPWSNSASLLGRGIYFIVCNKFAFYVVFGWSPTNSKVLSLVPTHWQVLCRQLPIRVKAIVDHETWLIMTAKRTWICIHVCVEKLTHTHSCRYEWTAMSTAHRAWPIILI